MDFINEPLAMDRLGPILHLKYTFGSLIANLCSKLRTHIFNKDIHVTLADKKKWDELATKLDELTAKVDEIVPTTATSSASTSILNNEEKILKIVDEAGYLKEIPVCYVTRSELPFLIAA